MIFDIVHVVWKLFKILNFISWILKNVEILFMSFKKKSLF
jgi:hypothetical protein